MIKRISVLLIPVFLAVVSAKSQQGGSIQQPAQAQVIPLKPFSPIHRFETLSGDPAKTGPYVVRIHAEAGYVIMPHFHPEDENIVVLQGSWAAGMGERFNRQALESMEVGTYALLPKKMAHFALSKTQTIIQVHGLGPFTPYYVVPNYELTDKGVLLRTVVTEPAKSTSTSPPNCFTLKLGTKVRGSYGEGVVVAAQCTPGQLTQYRIEKPDGDHFWAQRDELNMP
jgi:ChrR-like protein with cupin domain